MNALLVYIPVRNREDALSVFQQISETHYEARMILVPAEDLVEVGGHQVSFKVAV